MSLGAAVAGSRNDGAAGRVASGARPRLELTVSIEKSTNDLRNQCPCVHLLAMDVVGASVAFEADVQVASYHDAELNRTKRFGDARASC